MNEEYFKEQSRLVRAIAEKADPFTKSACWHWRRATTSGSDDLEGHPSASIGADGHREAHGPQL